MTHLQFVKCQGLREPIDSQRLRRSIAFVDFVTVFQSLESKPYRVSPKVYQSRKT